MFSSDVPVSLFPDGLPGPGPDPTAPISFADYDLSEVHEYSNLQYSELRSSLGFRYRAGRNLGLFGTISYLDLEDDEPYLQDYTGSATLVAAGVTWSF